MDVAGLAEAGPGSATQASVGFAKALNLASGILAEKKAP